MPGEPILIVDDNAANLKLARVLLVGEGYDVKTANDAEQAIALLETWKPRLILMDIQLPGMDGLELTTKLKADPRTNDIVVVALTAYAMRGDEQKARAAGCDGYIAKPIDPDTLPRSVAEHLGTSATAPAPPEIATRTVLVIEDNPTTSRIYRDALEEAGYEVVEARDGKTALEALDRRAPNLVLLDLCLGDMDGLELTRRVRALPRGLDLPIVALSGINSLAEESVALPSGFDALLVKPVEPARLIGTIRMYFPSILGPTEDLGGGRRLLVVDDDPVQLKLARIHLTQAGFDVTTVSDATAALDTARADPPDLIVTDALMPGMDGFDLCLAVRREARLAKIPVIIVSSHYRADADHDLAKEVGADMLLLRSPDFQSVTHAIVNRLKLEAPVPAPGKAGPSKAERERRLIRQLERQVTINATLAQRCSLQATQLSALATVADALARSGDVEAALHDVLHACLDAGGISKGAVYTLNAEGALSLEQTIGFAE
ncbi:MAG: response regulator, partial [Planctomycetota bacterium]